MIMQPDEDKLSEDSPWTSVKPVPGTVVWVRRRNGSWWPGRIICKTELGASHLLSPRSGTPVKLLGREDASVDWYNIEKSKRVKPFRCGEFDECIERAKSTGSLNRRREKYARREDAILDAIELERQQMDGLNATCEVVPVTKRPRGKPRKSTESGVSYSGNGYDLCSVPANGLPASKTRPGAFRKYPRKTSAWMPTTLEEEQALDLEEEGTGLMPRMRGLQDLVSDFSILKNKISDESSLEGTSETCTDTFCTKPVIGDHNMGISTGLNGKLLVKKKRSSGRPSEDGPAKRRDKKRPILQVLESLDSERASPSLFSNCASKPIDVSGVFTRIDMGYISHIESSKPRGLNMSSAYESFGKISECQAGKAFDDCESTQEATNMAALMPEMSRGGLLDAQTAGYALWPALTDTHAAGSLLAGSQQPCISCCVRTSSTTEFVEKTTSLPFVYDDKISIPCSHCHSNKSGKPYGNMKEGFEYAAGSEGTSTVSRLPQGPGITFPSLDSCSRFFTRDSEATRHLNPAPSMDQGKANSICMPLKYEPSDSVQAELEDRVGAQKGGYELPARLQLSDSCTNSAGYTENFQEQKCLPPPGSRDRGFVDDSCAQSPGKDKQKMLESNSANEGSIKKRASQLEGRGRLHGEAVPMVSLFSFASKKAVVGYPVTVEPLERNDSDDYFELDGNDCDENGSLDTRPVWQTARRTARQRTPRSIGIAECKRDARTQSKHSLNAGRGHHPSSHHVAKEISKRLLRKACLTSKKIRTLSSISDEKRSGQLISEGLDGGDQEVPGNGHLQNDFQLPAGDGNHNSGVNTNFTFCNPTNGNFEKKIELELVSGGCDKDSNYNLGSLRDWPVKTCIPVSVALRRLKDVVCL